MPKSSQQDKLDRRSLPSVDRLLSDERVKRLGRRYSQKTLTRAAREAIGELRAAGAGLRREDLDRLHERVAQLAEAAAQPSLRPAINATGVILHTGLGRAVLPERAVEAMLAVARGHCNLEIDLETGKRGSRISHVESLLCELTGAEAATVVNNNAAATFLTINTLAACKQVVVSRGQLVEIGGSFRLPEIIERAGARLREVGTTNRTRISDYESAILSSAQPSEEFGAVMRVHPSNFRIVGFTEEAALEELVLLARNWGLAMVDDLGSGALIDAGALGLAAEPTIQASIKAGCDAVIFSGDKMLGGPQAGYIIGKRHVVDACRRNPIARVVRVDKLTLAAAEATLRVYRDADDPVAHIPALRCIAQTPATVRRRALKLAAALRKTVGGALQVELIGGFSEVGGGSLPGQQLPTTLVSLRSSGISADDLSEHFRGGRVPIIGRVAGDRFLLDARTILDGEIAEIAARAQDAATDLGRTS